MVPAVPVGAQTLAQEDPVLRQIWNQAVNNSRIEPMAQTLLDSIGPRLVGVAPVEPAPRTGRWRTLQSWGIQAERKQYGTWEGWDRGISHIDLMAPRVRSLEGRILAFSPGTGGKPVEGGVIAIPTLANAADFEAFLPQVKGKFVMVSVPAAHVPANSQWEEFGAAGIVRPDERSAPDRRARLERQPAGHGPLQPGVAEAPGGGRSAGGGDQPVERSLRHYAGLQLLHAQGAHLRVGV